MGNINVVTRIGRVQKLWKDNHRQLDQHHQQESDNSGNMGNFNCSSTNKQNAKGLQTDTEDTDGELWHDAEQEFTEPISTTADKNHPGKTISTILSYYSFSYSSIYTRPTSLQECQYINRA